MYLPYFDNEWITLFYLILLANSSFLYILYIPGGILWSIRGISPQFIHIQTKANSSKLLCSKAFNTQSQKGGLGGSLKKNSIEVYIPIIYTWFHENGSSLNNSIYLSLRISLNEGTVLRKHMVN